MDLDRISVRARLRTPWEALDLGFVMARQWWLPLCLSWAIPSLLVFVVISLMAGENNWLPYVVVWWLKPLWDRGPLYIASRRLFGEGAKARDVFINLWRIYKTDLLASLTLRRLSLSRSFDLPLTVLENIEKHRRSERLTMLHRNHDAAAIWLTVVGVMIEGLFLLGIFSFIALMVPEQVDLNYLRLLGDEERILEWLLKISLFIAMALVGPFYVSAGFALYISRRIELEAWDIEIRFRHLSALYQRKNQTGNLRLSVNGAIGVAATLIAVLSLAPPTVIAQQHNASASASDSETYTQSPPAKIAKQQMFEVLSAEAFHQRETLRGWRLKDRKQTTSETPQWLIELFATLAKLMQKIGEFFSFLAWPLQHLQTLLWAGAALLVGLLMYKFRKSIGDFMATIEPSRQTRQAPEVMFGLDVTKQSLPEDIPGSVKTLWLKKQHRSAVSLLYRALLTGLIHDYNFAFADSHTEGECVALVKQQGNLELSQFAVKLTDCWQRLAYGHLLPPWDDIKALCDQWQQVFPNE